MKAEIKVSKYITAILGMLVVACLHLIGGIWISDNPAFTIFFWPAILVIYFCVLQPYRIVPFLAIIAIYGGEVILGTLSGRIPFASASEVFIDGERVYALVPLGLLIIGYITLYLFQQLTKNRQSEFEGK